MDMLDEVIDWIATVDDNTLDTVLMALQARHDDLHEERASRARPGAHVVVYDVEPRFLEGLAGQIASEDPDQGTVDILLTPESTGRLRFCGQRSYATGADMRYLLEGVPASCCYAPTGLGGVFIQPA